MHVFLLCHLRYLSHFIYCLFAHFKNVLSLSWYLQCESRVFLSLLITAIFSALSTVPGTD